MAHDWESYLGQQLKDRRLRLNISQDELARRAGVGIVTVSRLEGGKGSSLRSFIKVIQVLGQEDWLERLAPEASVSPIQIHALGKPRQRARARTTRAQDHPRATSAKNTVSQTAPFDQGNRHAS